MTGNELMLKCNVSVCPSAIENSSNSIGEALAIGMPVVASYVGGTPDFIEHNKEGFLYPFNEYYMLQHYIERIFKSDDIAKKISCNAYERAKKLYDRNQNKKDLIEIYEKIIKK